MKKLILFAITAIFSLNLFCQVHWTKHPDNPVLTPGALGEWDEEFIESGCVTYYDNTYHMWYTGIWYFQGIGHATSPDGIMWTKDANNPVLHMGPGNWENEIVRAGDVIVIDSIFHMWYSGSGSGIGQYLRIGHATSPDGVTWTKDINNPVLDAGPECEWDGSEILVGSVLYSPTGYAGSYEYHIWYMVSCSGDPSIGHATSPDGVSWTKDELNPVLTSESGKWDYPIVDAPAVIFDGTTYHMWYSGRDWFTGEIGYATSEDGSVWTKYANNPVFGKGSGGSWDGAWVERCSVIDSSGIKYKMWYTGGNQREKGSIGYAESKKTATNIPKTALLNALIKVYPNPTNNLLTIEPANPGQHSIEINSLNGQLIYSAKMKGTTQQINLSSFQKGVYLITIRSKDFVTTKKIIKL